MTDPDKHRSNGGDADEDGGGSLRKNDQKNRKVKRVSLFRFRKVHRRNKPPSSNSTSCCFLGKREQIGGYCLCFNQTPTEDFLVESQENDPNCSGYGSESLRTLIEKNDFFCRESNTHLEINTISTSNRFEELTARLLRHKKKVLQLGHQAVGAECLVLGAGKFLLGIYRKIKIVVARALVFLLVSRAAIFNELEYIEHI